MIFIFKDRFYRTFFIKSQYYEAIGYSQSRSSVLFNRDTLPSSFWLNGDIFWYHTKINWHCTTGPSSSTIKGEIDYAFNGNEMSKMEWLMAIE